MKTNSIKPQICLLCLLLTVPLLLAAQTSSTKIKIVTELANIREKPAIDSPIIKQVQKDDVLESVGKQGEWYRVVFEKESGEATTGYIHESLVNVLKSPAEQLEEKTVKTVTEKKPGEKPSVPPSKETAKTPQIPKKIPQPRAESKFVFPPLGIFLSGGGNFTLGGDLNEGAQGLADYYEEITGVPGQYKVHPVHFSYLISGDLFFPLDERAFVGIGIDYLQGELESTVKYDRLSAIDYYSTRPKIQALPVGVYLAYYYRKNTYAKIGLEYYFATAEYYYRFESSDFWQEYVGKAKAQGVGFLFGIGFESKLSSFASAFLEARGRFCKLKNFEGTNTYREFDGADVTTYQEEGTLYFYKAQATGDTTYPLLYISERKPAEAGVFDPRVAIVDFSGASVRLGIKIRF